MQALGPGRFGRRLCLTALLLITLPWSTSFAAEYPERTIKIVVPFPAGGPTDVAYDSDAARDFENIPGVDVIERAARNSPHKIAIDDGTVRLTWPLPVSRRCHSPLTF